METSIGETETREAETHRRAHSDGRTLTAALRPVMSRIIRSLSTISRRKLSRASATGSDPLPPPPEAWRGSDTPLPLKASGETAECPLLGPIQARAAIAPGRSESSAGAAALCVVHRVSEDCERRSFCGDVDRWRAPCTIDRPLEPGVKRAFIRRWVQAKSGLDPGRSVPSTRLVQLPKRLRCSGKLLHTNVLLLTDLKLSSNTRDATRVTVSFADTPDGIRIERRSKDPSQSQIDDFSISDSKGETLDSDISGAVSLRNLK